MPKVPCTDYQHEGYPSEDDEPCTTCNGTGYVQTANGDLLDTVEQELLQIGRQLAETHSKLGAAILIAQGYEVQKDEHADWYSTDEHYTPLVNAKEALTEARALIRRAVVEVQGTNPCSL